MTCKDLKASLRNVERLDMCLYGREKKNPIFSLITLCKQMSYHVSNALNISDMSTTLGICISIITFYEFRDVLLRTFRNVLPQEILIFRST